MPRDSDLIHVPLEANLDPRLLQELLSAQHRYQRLRSVRRYFVAVLALLGGGLWLLTMFPAAVPAPTRTFGLELWGICLCATVVTALLEFKSYRRRAKLLSCKIQGGSP